MIDFVVGLRTELAIITNGSNLADFDEVKEMAKNVKSTSLINKNVMAVATNLTVAEVKEFKVQILELKVEIKEAKYISQEDWKQPQNNERNRKPPYKGLNRKPIDKRNLKCFNCEKKGYFKSECWAKPKNQTRNWTDYKNTQFLKSEQSKAETSDSEMKEVNLNYQRICIYNWKYNAA